MSPAENGPPPLAAAVCESALMRFRTLTGCFSGSIAIRGLGAALALAVSVLMARALGVAEFGRYMTLFSVALLLSGLAVRGSDQLLIRELAVGARSDARLQQRALGRWATKRVGLGVALAVIGYLAWAMLTDSRSTFDGMKWSTMSATITLIGLSAACTLEAGALNGFSASLRSQSLVSVARNAAVLVLLGLVMSTSGGPHRAADALWLQAGAFALALFLGGYWLYGLAWNESGGRMDALPVRRVSAAMCPQWSAASRHFLLVTVAALLVNRLDVILVSSLAGAKTAGIYAVGARLAQIALMVAMAINVVLSPRIAVAWGRGDHATVRRLFRSALAFTVPIAVIEVAVAVGFAPRIVSLFGPAYHAAATPFAWVVLAYALWTVGAPAYVLLAMTGSEKSVAALSWLVFIVNVPAMLLLVPFYGSTGAGIAMAAGYAPALLLIPYVLRKARKADVSPCKSRVVRSHLTRNNRT